MHGEDGNTIHSWEANTPALSLCVCEADVRLILDLLAQHHQDPLHGAIAKSITYC